MDGAILVFTEINGSSRAVAVAERIEGDAAAGGREPEGVGAIAVAGAGENRVSGRLLGKCGKGAEEGDEEE